MRIRAPRLIGACFSIALLAACGGDGLVGTAERSAPPPFGARLGRITPLSKESVVYSFKNSPDGLNPTNGLLVGSNGKLYGATYAGGSAPSGGDGSVFQVSTSGAEKVLYSFQYGTDGAGPQAPVIEGKSGNLFGETDYGGNLNVCTYGCGTVYRLKRTRTGYKESILYTFQRGTDGAQPLGGLLLDASGGLYGTTLHGGGAAACSPSSLGCGTVFKLTPTGSGYTESILYAFKGKKDGAYPVDQLIGDGTGALYGTTQYGGESSGACSNGPSGSVGCGTIFKLTPSGSHYTETILYRFKGGMDGAYPRAGLVIANGILYGATTNGGSSSCTDGCGTVYRVKKSGAENVLYSFKGSPGDGTYPLASLVDLNGILYGTTSAGGTHRCGSPSDGCGTVFSLTTSGSEQVLYNFQGTPDGWFPDTNLVSVNGALYGTTTNGGAGSPAECGTIGCGSVFKVIP